MQIMIKKDTDDLKAIAFTGMIFDLIFLASYGSVQQMVDDVSSSDEELNLSQGYIDLDPAAFVQPEGNKGV